MTNTELLAVIPFSPQQEMRVYEFLDDNGLWWVHLRVFRRSEPLIQQLTPEGYSLDRGICIRCETFVDVGLSLLLAAQNVCAHHGWPLPENELALRYIGKVNAVIPDGFYDPPPNENSQNK